MTPTDRQPFWIDFAVQLAVPIVVCVAVFGVYVKIQRENNAYLEAAILAWQNRPADALRPENVKGRLP